MREYTQEELAWQDKFCIQPNRIRKNMNYSHAIKAYRQLKNITQHELSRRLAVSIDTIRGWEQSQYNPAPYILIALAMLD